MEFTLELDRSIEIGAAESQHKILFYVEHPMRIPLVILRD